MKISGQKLLIGTLLVLVGALSGISLVLYTKLLADNEVVQVRVAEIQKSRFTPDRVVSDVGNPAAGLNVFKEISARITPTVVYIEATVPATRAQMPKDGNHNFDRDVWDRFLPGRRVQTVGSGVIITQDGYIVTNNHVVENALNNKVEVVLHDKRQFEAEIIGRDPSTDLAVLKIESDELPVAVMGDSRDLEVGDWVLAIGNPFRLRSTVTAGIISALSRDVDVIDDQMRIESFIQTDAAINKGNSGGALVNGKGDLIGINTAIATESGSYEGYGFAIPINMAVKIATDIIEYGEVKRAYMGVQIASVDQRRAKVLGLPAIAGVEIVDLVRDGSADRAGLKRGDVVIAVDGYSVSEYNELQAKIAEMRPGSTAELTIWRKGKSLNKTLLLMGLENEVVRDWIGVNDVQPESPEPMQFERDADGTVESFDSDLGFSVSAIPEKFNLKRFDLVVSAVSENSTAALAGVKKEDRIVQVNGIRVEQMAEFRILMRDGLAKKGKVTLKVEREGGSIATLEIQP